MALSARNDYEAEFARRYSKASAKQKRELLVLLGDTLNIGNVPISFWDNASGEMVELLSPVMIEIFMDSAEQLGASLPIGVDWGLVNEHAASWARQYTFELVKGVTNTTRRALQAALNNFFQRGQTRADLEAQLVRIYGPVRAEAIAITEVTRAATEGERQIAAELAREGVDMVPFWVTREDELVCPLCGPRNGKEITDGKFPPIHPRDRCGTRYELPKVKR